ncbi:hypothetical protein [Niabella hibiscisoli]|uniref:hypothetical protein n=1 Tax=Niabella hibiscisoli TaxID=1825928 RepID=UPI001F0E13EF|nr:hypothetical protein [Niabella hibiscisoli]MCH5721303.1 hypothetical protein [Niabella hibiscisoli]
MLALVAFLFNKRSRVVFAFMMLASVIILNTGCTKNGNDVSDYTNQDVFVRIKQIDKDGTARYSQVVQAIRK